MLDVNVKKDNMKTLEAYRAGLMIKPQLRHLFLELTLRCNEKCLHCGSSCGDQHSEELTVAQYSKFLAEVKGDFGIANKMLCITGGEPLLRKDFFDIMAIAHELGFHWGLRGQRLGTLYSKPGASRTGYIPASLETVNILAAKERELRIRTIMCPAENFDEEWDRCVAAYLSAGGSRAIEAKRSAYRESIAEKKGN